MSSTQGRTTSPANPRESRESRESFDSGHLLPHPRENPRDPSASSFLQVRVRLPKAAKAAKAAKVSTPPAIYSETPAKVTKAAKAANAAKVTKRHLLTYVHLNGHNYYIISRSTHMREHTYTLISVNTCANVVSRTYIAIYRLRCLIF